MIKNYMENDEGVSTHYKCYSYEKVYTYTCKESWHNICIQHFVLNGHCDT
jgi:hypothetical protein